MLEKAKELIQLSKEATGDKWIFYSDGTTGRIVTTGKDEVPGSDANGKFIAFAHNHAPDMAEALIKAVGLLEDVVSMCADGAIVDNKYEPCGVCNDCHIAAFLDELEGR